ncbi:CBS domain-containing protein [Pyrofollis japonicus]|uniref:CBS domain-containing protein n=1 Tax=Pyrofollis japonicus TaxID=3060460 RepID=UPI00295B0FD7|nr:CBS domain-containing protein [Pyrofollis japonicus]BEP17717.1 CBS domain-containing protein [Pyrofollis japonicus]
MILLRKKRSIPLRAEDIMTQPPVTASMNTPLREISKLMIDKRIGSVLIVDEEGKLRGIVTERDIVFACAQGWDAETRQAWEVMTENPITVKRDENILEIIKKMRDLNVRHMPVVDEEGKPVGVISSRDIMDIVLTILGLATMLKETA